MKKLTLLLIGSFLILSIHSQSQHTKFEKINALIGNWEGEGSGFGNNKSKIISSFTLVMGGTYIEVKNDSKFEPTDKNPKGEHHIDWGMISYDKSRDKIVFRQFNIESFVNQYVLNEEKSTSTSFVFETENIENLSTGKARWIINIKNDKTIETIFDVSFSGDNFTCFGTNVLIRK